MDVHLCVKRALVVANVADERNIKSSCGDICANQNSLFVTTGLDRIDRSLESVETFKPLSLLHFGVQSEVANFEEV